MATSKKSDGGESAAPMMVEMCAEEKEKNKELQSRVEELERRTGTVPDATVKILHANIKNLMVSNEALEAQIKAAVAILQRIANIDSSHFSTVDQIAGDAETFLASLSPTDKPANEKDTFIDHLKRSSKIVGTWPAWKQAVLGGRVEPAKPSEDAVESEHVEGDDDICGLCGKPGADKVPHPEYWPGERMPGTEYVHADCEKAEQGRAFHALSKEECEAYLRTIR